MNQHIRMISEGSCETEMMLKIYGIRYVPIKMNVIFQETYENIN